MTELSKIVGLILFSSLKFFLAPAATVVVGYGFWETVVITFVGGTLGFLVFYKFGGLIKQAINNRFKIKSKSNFNFRNRIIVKIKRKYGFYGLALLTPCLLGIPLGALLAAAYFGKQKRTIPLFLGSILLWTLILTSISVQFKKL